METTTLLHDFSRIAVHARSPIAIQPKLRADGPQDIYEQEANHIADEVTRVPDRPLQGVSPGHRQRSTHRILSTGLEETAAPVVQDVLLSSGQPLEPAVRGFFDRRFGYDFSHVRVHADSRAAESARYLNADAFTVGRHIVFDAGRLAPGTPEGRRLMAHELTHVVQQSGLGRTAGLGRPLLLQRQPNLNAGAARQAIILSLDEIQADPEREKARKITGQTAAKVCRSISAGAGKENCPAALDPGAQVTIVAEKAGGAWQQILTPLPVPGFGPQEPLFVIGAFVRERPAQKPEKQAAATGGPATPKVGDTLHLDQTVPIAGLPMEQPNYLDRAVGSVESAPLGPDLTLIPRTAAAGQNGISVSKGDFFIDADPLSGPALATQLVYKSREVADAVVADLDQQAPGMPNYTFYLRDGVVFPTVLSDKTLPNLMPAIRNKREQDMLGVKAMGGLAKALFWWYIAARFPPSIKPGRVGTAPAVAADVALAGFDTAERGIILEVRAMLKAPEIAQLREAHSLGKEVTVKIGGRLIQYEPALRDSGLSMFGENGFLIGRNAFSSETEFVKTLLHETYRLTTSEMVQGAGAHKALVKAETDAAFSFAERAYEAVIEGE